MENRQTYFNCRSLFWGLGLSLIIRHAYTNFWLAEVIGMILGIITISVIKKTNSTKWFKLLSGFIFALFSTTILAYMGGTLYLNKTPDFVLSLFAVIGAFLVSNSKKGPYNRVVSLLFVMVVAIFLVGQAILVKDAKPANMLPLFQGSTSGLILSTLTFWVISVTPLLCLNDNDEKKNMLINYVMGTLSIILTSLILVLVLGINEAMLYRYPEYGVLKIIKIFEFFANVDNLFVVTLVTDMLITAASGIRKMELQNNLSKIITVCLLTFLTTFLCTKADIMALLYEALPYIMLVLLILTLLPIKSKYKTTTS